MNPILWKREHQLALVCAVVLGAFAGLISGLMWADTFSWFRWGALWCDRVDCVYLLTAYRLRLTMWATLGGVGAGALVYIHQLLRS